MSKKQGIRLLLSAKTSVFDFSRALHMQLIKLDSKDFCFHMADRSAALVTPRNAYVENKLQTVFCVKCFGFAYLMQQ